MRLGFAVVLGAAAAIGASSSFGSDDGSPSSTADAGDAPVLGDASSDGAAACDPSAVTNDAHNCGACGHDCLGGACQAGACQPFVVARTSYGAVAEIAVDRDNVYWNSQIALDEGGHLASCPKTGCATPTILSVQGQTVAGVGSDGVDKVFAAMLYAGSGVYELENGALHLKSDVLNARYLAVRPQGVLFVSFFEANDGRSIRLLDPAAAPSTKTICSYDGSKGTAYPAAYTDARAYLHANGQGFILTCPLSATGGPMATFLSNVYTSYMAGVGQTLYWTSGGTLFSCPDGDTCAGATGELGPSDVGGASIEKVTALGGQLYLQTSDGQIRVCNPGSCRTTHGLVVQDPDLDRLLPYAHNVAADDRAVYYSAVDSRYADGGPSGWRIMKLAK